MQLVYPSRLRLRSISTASMLIHGHYRHRKRTYQELLLAKQRCYNPMRTQWELNANQTGFALERNEMTGVRYN